MTPDMLNKKETQMVEQIYTQMGIKPDNNDLDEIDYAIKTDYEENKSLYDNRNVVSKPKFIEREEQQYRDTMIGVKIDCDLYPLRDFTIIKLDSPVKNKNGLFIAASVTDHLIDTGIVLNINEESDYDFKIGDRVAFGIHQFKARFNKDNNTILVIHKEHVYGIFE